jgi:hypothetical protein
MLYFLSLLLQRLPLTLGFIGSMAATIYVSMVLHSYILSVLFSVIQVSTFMLPFFFFFFFFFFFLWYYFSYWVFGPWIVVAFAIL